MTTSLSLFLSRALSLSRSLSIALYNERPAQTPIQVEWSSESTEDFPHRRFVDGPSLGGARPLGVGERQTPVEFRD